MITIGKKAPRKHLPPRLVVPPLYCTSWSSMAMVTEFDYALLGAALPTGIATLFAAQGQQGRRQAH